MTSTLTQSFSKLASEICNILYTKEYDKVRVNSLIDELNSKPFQSEVFVKLQAASSLIKALCEKIKPSDELLSSKTSHLLNSLITRQNLPLTFELSKVIGWHIQCLKICSGMILPDIVHNVQCILQCCPLAGIEYAEELLCILLNYINSDKTYLQNSHNSLQITLMSLKCISTLTSFSDEKTEAVSIEIKENVCNIVIKFLLKGFSKGQDEFLYTKSLAIALRILAQLYLNCPNLPIPLPEVMGISRHFLLLGLVQLSTKPERIMPSQQTIGPTPAAHHPKGGKKQKLRKQRNNAIESLKKEIPTDLKQKETGNFDMNSYTPASQNYLEPNSKSKQAWALTSDSDMSDVESGREAKLLALKSRVRHSASNLLLVIVKVVEKKDMFGYWWALLPDAPDFNNWINDEAAKKTLAYCAVSDPIASNRAGVLSVILALLSGSRMYLSQAESSKKESSSFIPFSVTLGYMITCMHTALVSILDNERIQSVVIVALKCCAALVQATPYHKMKEGLISELVRSSRKFLVHRDVTLQVGALITMGCVLSVDPKVDEVLKSIQKDFVTTKQPQITAVDDDECDDFEEGYSDDEVFVVDDKLKVDEGDHNFKSWILDICFRNMGWNFRGNEITKCKASTIPVILESLQVLSATSYHHFSTLVLPQLPWLPPPLQEMLAHEHSDVPPRAAAAVSIIADAINKLEQANQPPPLSHCLKFWEQLLPPLSAILQSSENPAAKAVACDCIANIGERSFKELPRRTQVLCCTLLVGSCSDEDPLVRAAAVRALAMAVMYRTLREDICFVSDCGENILRALTEQSLVVRAKAAWALGNLSDALVLNSEDPEIDEIDDDLLLRLLEVSVHCATDSDKVKMSATRGLGNLLRLINTTNLSRNTQIKSLCEMAIGKLIDCASKVTNMKVRWNACYAIGNAMKNQNLFTSFSGWQRHVFPSLCTLSQECKNIKVRINAAVALRSPSTREQYADQFAVVWRGVMAAMENAANIDDFNEYKHKDNLIEQLFVTFSHLACLLTPSDLSDIYDPLVFHYDCAKGLSTQLCHKLPPGTAACNRILEAAKYVTMNISGTSETQQQALGMLQEILIWDM